MDFQQWLVNESETTTNIFVYGTLRNGEVKKLALGHKPFSHKDTLNGWKKVCGTLELKNLKDKRNYCTIKKSPGSSVKGEVLTLTPSEIRKIDQWETNYVKQIVSLESGRKAYSYIMKNSALAHLK